MPRGGGSTRAGSDVDAICKKCGEMRHVVIAMTDRRIAKVECVQCGARHRYRAVGGAAGTGPGRASGRSTSSRGRSASRTPVVEADVSRPQRDFRMKDTYEVGDRVIHPRFGEGVVQQIASASKIVVLFDTGLKTLVQGRG